MCIGLAFVQKVDIMPARGVNMECECWYEDCVPKPVIICVLGHIDHGKTSLIDSIICKEIAASEAGAITQCLRMHVFKHKGTKLILLDTPGHSLFGNVRFGGIRIADIVMLVVSLQEGSKPQTIESAIIVSRYNLPVLIVYNKLDYGIIGLARVLTKIRTELADVGVIAESIGGNAIEIYVSSKSYENIKHLLDTLCLASDLLQLQFNISGVPLGVVMDIRLMKTQRLVLNVLMIRGTLENKQSVRIGSRIINVCFNDRFSFTIALCAIEMIGLSNDIRPGQLLDGRLSEIRQMNPDVNCLESQHKQIIMLANVIVKTDSFVVLDSIINLLMELQLNPV